MVFLIEWDVLKKIPGGIRVLLLSHSAFWLASNLLTPFLSIFYINALHGVTLVEVGIASLIYFLAFGLFEPVAGLIADKIPGLRDELALVFVGFLARGILFILLSFATNTWHLYMFEFFAGFFRGLAGPSDKKLFMKFIVHRQSGILWGLDESLINLSAAIGAGFGGYLVVTFGFRPMLVFAGVVTILAGTINYPLIKQLKPN